MSAAKSKRFSTVGYTAPSAEEAIERTPDVKTPMRHAAPTSRGNRVAFTWRLTPEQADQLDTLALDLRRQLGRGKLDRATVLQALVDLATENENLKADVAKRLDA